jgi:hypothetical protein
MIRSVAAELLVARKRASSWVLMGIWVLLGILFAYVTPYLSIAGGSQGQPPPPLATLLPERLADNLLGGFPFFGGVIALMLGVLAVGSEYGWDTLKTLLTQRAGRLWMWRWSPSCWPCSLPGRWPVTPSPGPRMRSWLGRRLASWCGPWLPAG